MTVEQPLEERIDKRFRRRDANFELLRILAMFMVIVLHYLAHGGLLPAASELLNRSTVTGAAVESLCIAAVNVWVLISGFFLSRTGVSLKRLFKVLLEVWFYTLIITSVMILTGNGSGIKGGFYGTLEAFLPISSEHYWFATAYVFMFLFSPLLNKGVIVLSRKQLKYTIIGLLFWFSIIKSFVPVALATDDYGYGFGWFLVLYLIAAYMRKYDVRILNSARGGLAVWFVSSAGIFVLTLLSHEVHLSTGRLTTWLGTPYHYNFILTLTAALGLFSAFRFLKIREGRFAAAVRFVAPLTFGVYLLHEHREIRDQWLVWIQEFIGPIPQDDPFLLCVHIIVSALVVYAAGIMVDFIRKTIFEWVVRVLSETGLGARFKKLDSSIHTERSWEEINERERS